MRLVPLILAALRELSHAGLMASFAYAVYFSVIRLSGYPLLACFALITAALAMAHFSKQRGIALAYPLAFVAGTGFEIVCITSGAWAYSRPDFLGVPLLLFFLWGASGLYMLDSYRRLQGLLGRTAGVGTAPVLAIAVIASSAVLVSLFWKEPFLLAGLLSLITLAMLFRKGKAELAIAMFAAFFGTFAEFGAVANGLWSYSISPVAWDGFLRIFNWVPIWLPLLWALAALGFVEINEYLLKHRFKRSFL